MPYHPGKCYFLGWERVVKLPIDSPYHCSDENLKCMGFSVLLLVLALTPDNYLITIDKIYKVPSVNEVSFDTHMLNYQLFHISSEFFNYKQQKFILADQSEKTSSKGYSGAHGIERKA